MKFNKNIDNLCFNYYNSVINNEEWDKGTIKMLSTRPVFISLMDIDTKNPIDDESKKIVVGEVVDILDSSLGNIDREDWERTFSNSMELYNEYKFDYTHKILEQMYSVLAERDIMIKNFAKENNGDFKTIKKSMINSNK